MNLDWCLRIRWELCISIPLLVLVAVLWFCRRGYLFEGDIGAVDQSFALKYIRMKVLSALLATFVSNF